MQGGGPNGARVETWVSVDTELSPKKVDLVFFLPFSLLFFYFGGKGATYIAEMLLLPLCSGLLMVFGGTICGTGD